MESARGAKRRRLDSGMEIQFNSYGIVLSDEKEICFHLSQEDIDNMVSPEEKICSDKDVSLEGDNDMSKKSGNVTMEKENEVDDNDYMYHSKMPPWFYY